MSSRRKKLPPTLDELRRAARLLIATSGRGGPIMAASWVDDSLEHLLRGYFSREPKLADELFGFDRPLGSFGTRTKVAYLLGLISKEVREDLDTIRVIRNELAHFRTTFSFAQANIKQRCKNLHTAKVFAENTPRASSAPRQQFITSAFLLSSAFIAMSHSIQPPSASDEVLSYVRRITKHSALQNALVLYGYEPELA